MVGPRMLGRAMTAHVSVATNIQRGSEAEQRDQGQSDGVRMPARSMNAKAPKREAGREDEGDRQFVRHRGAHRVTRLSLRSGKATTAGRSQQTSERAIQEDHASGRARRFPVSRILNGVEHNGMARGASWVSVGDAIYWAASLLGHPCSLSSSEVSRQGKTLHDYRYRGSCTQSAKSTNGEFSLQGCHD
ncbi:hypothetical protein GCM10007886_06080 [Methylobacterium gregans]|nr:hypothetical protein GCM10007886_06080 [Methylobacterium gregans]